MMRYAGGHHQPDRLRPADEHHVPGADQAAPAAVGERDSTQHAPRVALTTS